MVRQTASGHLGWYTLLSLVVHGLSMAWMLRALPLSTPNVATFEPVRMTLLAPALPESPLPMGAGRTLSPTPAAFPSQAAQPSVPAAPQTIQPPLPVLPAPTHDLPPDSTRMAASRPAESLASLSAKIPDLLPPPVQKSTHSRTLKASGPQTELTPPSPLTRPPAESPRDAPAPLTAPLPAPVISRPSGAVARLAIPPPPQPPPPSKAAATHQAAPTSMRVPPQAPPVEPSPRRPIPPAMPAAPLLTPTPTEANRLDQHRAAAHAQQPVATTPALSASSASPSFPPSHPGQSASSSPGVAAHNLGALFASKPCPMYPSMARRRGSEGTVVLEFDVLAGGHIGHIRVAQSSGHYLLDNAAQNAIKKWRPAPEAFNGREATRLTVPFTFELDKPDGSRRQESKPSHSDRAIICDENTQHG